MSDTDTAASRSKTAATNDHLRVGLAMLWQAYTYAQDSGADRWDFALEIDKLYATGLTISDLRWLVAKRFAEHGQESSVYGAPHRSFRPGVGFFFEHGTCLVLTPSGAAFASDFLNESSATPQSTQPIETASIAGGENRALDNSPPPPTNLNGSLYLACKPCWCSTRRELSLGGIVVKHYRVPAQNQELILSAFEEDGWPDQIDDPLPVSGVDPHTRLHDAVNRLNRAQTNSLLRFHGNGDGTGVAWKIRQPVASRQTPTMGTANK